MAGDWIRRNAIVLAAVLFSHSAFAANDTPRWVSAVDAGSPVSVTMRNGGHFEAIWFGRDGDRAVFERFDPDETVIVPFSAVRDVRVRKGHASSKIGLMVALGAVAGFFGVGFLIKVSS